MSDHSPTPFSIYDDGRGVTAIVSGLRKAWPGEGAYREMVFDKWICGGDPYEGAVNPDDPDIQFILRACNAHDDLVAACDSMSTAIDFWQAEQADDDAPHVVRMRHALDRGITALRAAGVIT